MEQGPSRKLAVLLHADVVGSTALVRLDETLAHQRIRDSFRRLSQTIGHHGGTAHEIRGDALVAEFSMASDAVAAALDFQAANAAYNRGLSDEVRPVIRVGLAIGEIVVADDTLTGEGVVLAQRLEQIAVPGGVCIQGAVYDTVPKRMPFDFENLGEQEVKGFDSPVRVYSVSLKTATSGSKPAAPARQQLPEGRTADRPSVAVLPLRNLSGDPEQEYFSDGLTKDIIAALTAWHYFPVISRNSSFAFKGKAESLRAIADKLGARYVLEGSVRKGGAV